MSRSATIRRGAAPRKTVRPTGKALALRRRSRIDRAIDALPVSHATLRRVAAWSIVSAAGAIALAVAILFGVPQAAALEMAEAAGRAGLRVNQIEVTGLKRMDRMSVYAQALKQKSRAMPLVDVAQVRADLLAYGWVQDVQVSRRLPDTLHINIVEREPKAIWQVGGELTLIDGSGVWLEPVDPAAMPDLPLLIGPGADKQAIAFAGLMEAAPALKPMVKAARWIGDRRWDLQFESGELLMLPEGDRRAAAALVKFATMDGTDHVLGQGFLRFDMRNPEKTYVRVPREGVRKPIKNATPARTPSTLLTA